jgi:hypothetical protein
MTGLTTLPFVIGPPGSGKSRFLNGIDFAPTISSDEIRSRLFALRDISHDAGAAILRSGGSVAEYEEWRGYLDSDVLSICRDLRADGWVVELGGPLGLHLQADDPALCVMPTSRQTMLARLRERSESDHIALLWLAAGGNELAAAWHDAFARRSWSHGVHSEIELSEKHLRRCSVQPETGRRSDAAGDVRQACAEGPENA